MTKTQRESFTRLIPILMLIAVTSGNAAVTSVGEINVVGDDQGGRGCKFNRGADSDDDH